MQTQADSKRILTGTHFMLGNWAVVEGALAAGCNFFAGYPITPANEISERMSERMPQVDGSFLQAEDELCAVYALSGAALAFTFKPINNHLIILLSIFPTKGLSPYILNIIACPFNHPNM